MTDRFDFLHVPEPKTKPAPEVFIAPEHAAAPLAFTRQDVEAGIFSGCAACVVMLVMNYRGAPVGDAFYLGVIAFFVVAGYVYGVRVMGRAAQDTARAVVGFREVIRPRLVLQADADAEEAETVSGEEPDLVSLWRAAMQRYMLGAQHARGFTIRKMTAKRLMTGTTWRVMTAVFVQNGVLCQYPEGMGYAAGVTRVKALEVIHHGRLVLPQKPPPRRVLIGLD